jgi:hypothetical protein
VTKRDWGPILATAKAIVESYDTGVTLRQLFYRLVSAEILRNSESDYKQLSSRTAEARRDGTFPDLIDASRSITQAKTYASPADALRDLHDTYRRDRTEGQAWGVYLGVEKEALVELLWYWFADMGVPIVATKGYGSQTFVSDVARDVARQNRPCVLLYGGDFDPSGEDIERDFRERTACFAKLERIALTAEQVTRYNLPEQPGKAKDTRAKGFIERHGKLCQVELDALPPDVLHSLYREALAPYLDLSKMEESKVREREDRGELWGAWNKAQRP